MQMNLSEIRIDGGTQPRDRIDESIVAEYASAMREGSIFPPVIVFVDGVDTWLADGFHRFHAVRKNEVLQISADVRTGTRRDAILFSVGANAAHGARRTNEDKRRAVMTLLNDVEWTQWSDSEIARRTGVSHVFVGDVRRGYRTRSITSGHSGQKISLETVTSEKTYITKHGAKSTMRTEHIGKSHGLAGAREQHIKDITALAKDGHNAAQIAERIGISKQTVRRYALSSDISLPEHVIGKTRALDNHRVIEQTILSIEASAASIRTIGISLAGIDKEQAKDWLDSISESIKIFNSLRKKLQENAHAKA